MKVEKLIRLISDDDAEYYRLRRRAIQLPEAERASLERKADRTLEEVKRVLLGDENKR